MLKNLLKVLLILLLFVINTQLILAHGEDNQPQPTVVPNTQANSSDGTVFETSQEISSESTIDPRLLTIMMSLVLSLIAVGTIWLIIQGQLPWIAFGIGILISYTAFTHLAVGISGELLLIANGLGYLVWMVVRMIPRIRASRLFNWIDSAIIVYTIITFVGYFTLHGHIELVGVTSKVAEALLIVFLVYRIFALNSPLRVQPQTQSL